MIPWLTVVGIGEDGYPGLGKQARRALLEAQVVIGGPRQLALLPPCIRATREPWPQPFALAPDPLKTPGRLTFDEVCS